MPEILDAAKQYTAQEDWAVFPAYIGHGQKKSYKSAEHSDGVRWGATRDLRQIRRDFTRFWKAHSGLGRPFGRPQMIGIPTGADNRFIVIEIDVADGRKGRESLAMLEAKLGPLSPTRQQRTPSGSIHFLFRHPGVKVRNSASELAPNVDVRGDGGMILAPPTVRSDGVYEWINDLPIAALPPAWLALLASERAPHETDGVVRVSGRAPSPVPAHVKIEHAGAGTSTEPDDLPDPDEALFALGSIPPHDIGNTEWFRIGRALFNHFGDDGLEHFVEWSDWSRQKYPKGKTPQQQWHDFERSPNPSITIASLFDLANKHAPGWRELYRLWKEQHHDES